jgi:hypothetical protein
MTQQNCRGAYVDFTHDRQEDWDWLVKWQPNVIRYMFPGSHSDPNSVDVGRIRRIHETCPDATILLRCWDIDDRNTEAHDAMVADPKAEAERQVDWWAKVIDKAVMAGVPRQLMMAGLNNETAPGKDSALYPYTEFALEFATPRAIRLGVYVFSVGRPGLEGESQYDIPYFSRLDSAIVANHGAICLNEYMQPEGMYAVWTDKSGNERKDYTYLMGRHTRWAVNADVIISEWGLDGLLYNRHPDPQYGNSGWLNFKQDWPPSRYADEYVEYIRVASDNVIGVCPFLSDWNDHHWQSFDMISAYGEFLARKDKCVKGTAISTTPPSTIHLPAIGTGATTPMFVVAPAGLNLRDAPVTGNVITAIPYGSQVDVIGPDDANPGWLEARYEKNAGYVYSKFLSYTQPAPTQPVTPTGDKWQRAIDFILNEEGGYTANDEGNPANFGINQGANPDIDVAHLTRDGAIELYRTRYYEPSGADKLSWPFNLLVMDAAVQHGVPEAKELLAQSGGNPLLFQGLRQQFYGQIQEDSWQRNGRAWMNRMGRLLAEASKA